jgi:hypothetical protein
MKSSEKEKTMDNLRLDEYDWEHGDVLDSICPFCLDELPDGDDPTEFFEPTDCSHVCCWRCSRINPKEGWSLCPRCAKDCTDYDLLKWNRPSQSWIGTYKNWTVRVALRDDNSCVGIAESSDGRTVSASTDGRTMTASTPWGLDQVWVILVGKIEEG